MDVSGISAASTAISANELKQSVDIAVLKKATDAQTEQVNALLQGMTAAQHPYLGQSIDLKI
ncbi:YjfB family protein [Paenibacillus sp. UNC451MF]|uniref:YjfB family protein n=1 Tax=Paenibacillus sp. UNC451MF TaxID=1449063 RepID=UPI00048DC09B|nr:YjfB family protein [Paenibacillus sp. UNC451MF]